MIPSLGLVAMLACAVFYYKIGESEYSSGLVMGCVSVALWLAASFFLGWGWLGCLLVQATFFAGLTIWNVVRDKSGQ
jgi:hypothetical protein